MKQSWVEQDGREEREWGRGMVILIKICINMSKEKNLTSSFKMYFSH